MYILDFSLSRLQNEEHFKYQTGYKKFVDEMNQRIDRNINNLSIRFGRQVSEKKKKN